MEQNNYTENPSYENMVGMCGELTEINPTKKLCGIAFDGFIAKVKMERHSGVVDEIVVVFNPEVIDWKAIAPYDSLQEGSRIMIIGAMQTLKDFTTGKLLVYVLAEYIALAPKVSEQNKVHMQGIIAREPIYRTTPRGKRITDLAVMIPNQLKKSFCYVPCICWDDTADEAANWKEGDIVNITGRFQSRQYVKQYQQQENKTKEETKTAYEVSVSQIENIRLES